MFEDNETDGETLESGEATEAVSSDSGSMDTSDTVETSSEPLETAADAVESLEEAVPDVFDWNGEVESLREADWVQRLDMSVRDAVLRGVESKYRNFERGYTKAFQENSVKRRALEAREKEIRDTELRVQRWLHGEVDPMEEKQREVDLLKQQHSAALDTLYREHEKAITKQQTAHADALDEMIQQREAAQARAVALEQQEAQREQAAMDAEVDQFENWIKEAAPHVYGDQDALYALCVNVASGIDKTQALKMVLATHPSPVVEPEEPPPAEPAEVPQAVEMMNLGASSAANTEPAEHLSFDQKMDVLRRAAMAEELAFINSSS